MVSIVISILCTKSYDNFMHNFNISVLLAKVILILFIRYRQVDPAKLNTLKDLINAPNYKDNLATLIRTIYEFAFLTYAGTINNPFI